MDIWFEATLSCRLNGLAQAWSVLRVGHRSKSNRGAPPLLPPALMELKEAK